MAKIELRMLLKNGEKIIKLILNNSDDDLLKQDLIMKKQAKK